MRSVLLIIGVVLATGLAAGVLLLPKDPPVTATYEGMMALPSGLKTEFHEMLSDQSGGGLVYRFRFVAPELAAADNSFETLMVDLEHLCNGYAIQQLANVGEVPNQVIISLADRKSEFGVIDASVAQVFEAYRIESGTCIWEMF